MLRSSAGEMTTLQSFVSNQEVSMLALSLAFILFLGLTLPVAAEPPSACSLLTPGDVESAIGGKVSATQPLQFDDSPTGPNRSVKVQGCMWGVTTPLGRITISWFQGPLTDEQIAQLITMTKSNPGVD